MRVFDIRVIGLHLRSHQLPFINKGLAGKTANIKIFVIVIESGPTHSPCGAFTHTIKPSFKSQLVFDICSRTNKNLFDNRLSRTGRYPDGCIIYRNIPPTQKFQTLGDNRTLHDLLALFRILA